jgi:hypothetical protein
MKGQYLTIFVITVLISSVFIDNVFSAPNDSEEIPLELFVGVDVAYNNIDEMYALIDEVSQYTNVFVIGTEGVAFNSMQLLETCQYLYDRGMYFIIYTESFFRLELINDIEEKYGEHFLGVYFDDEQGGRQLDLFEFRWVYEASDYSNAATQFVQGLKWWLDRNIFWNESYSTPRASDFHLFTSDYALYWFDYDAGYDTVFAEFGWNYSRQLNVALCRGAATVQNKEWGAIITWTYNNPPYIESGTELYKDLLLAYENGAKYILVFDSNKEYTQGILQEEHLEALKQFWNYTKNNPRTSQPSSERVAYVLPKDYAYGFRGPNDKIWGLWEADSFSNKICVELGNLLKEHESKLDIIYDDPKFNYKEKYAQLYFANSTIISNDVSCEADSSRIIIGNPVTINGCITPPLQTGVIIQISSDNGTTWNDLNTSTTSASDGFYSYTWTPEYTGFYEVRTLLEGDNSTCEAYSNTQAITVSKIQTTISHSVSSNTLTEGNSITVSGITDPAASDHIITLTIEKPDGSTLTRTVTTTSDGSFAYSFKPEAIGYWSITASSNEDSTFIGASSPEKSFELIQKELNWELPLSIFVIIGIAVAVITSIAITAWFIRRSRKRPSAIVSSSTVKAQLLGVGSGKLEFIDNTIKFHIKKSYLRRRKEFSKEIHMADIEGMNRVGNELNITWKGITYPFIIEEKEIAGTIFEKIPQTSREQRERYYGLGIELKKK